MKVLSTLTVMMVSEYYAISILQAEEFVAGILFGLIQKDDLKYIQTCLTDADTVEEQVNDAISDFMKGDISSILAGIEVVGTLLTELPADLKDCEDMQGDLTRISAWVSGLIADPVKLAELLTTNIIRNFAKITGDINSTSADIVKADYYTAGSDIADIVILTLGNIPAEDMTLFWYIQNTIKSFKINLIIFLYNFIMF